MNLINLSKLSKQFSIILLITVFSIAGIISCVGENITGNIRGSGTNNNDTSEGRNITFPDNTYYTIYAPNFTNEKHIKVSYLDTNTLNDIWKDI